MSAHSFESRNSPDPRIQHVGDFLSNYGKPDDPGVDPHRYPGERPDHSYLTDGTDVMPLELATDGEFRLTTEAGVVNANDWLSAQGVKSIEDRIPVLTYGANLCPSNLARKFSVADREDLQIVPTVYGWMRGIEAVWHERPSQRGAYFAELYTGPEVADTEVQVGINFLTPEQLLILHKGESTYEFGHFSEVKLSKDQSLPAFIYGGSGRVMLRDGQPIAMAGVRRRNNVLPIADSRQVLEYQFSFPAFHAAAAKELGMTPGELTPPVFTDKILRMKVIEKRSILTALTKVVHSITDASGHDLSSPSSMSEHPDFHPFSWANPSTIPTYGDIKSGKPVPDKLIRLPYQELPPHNLSEQGMLERQKVLRAIRVHCRRVHGISDPTQ